MPRRIMPIKTSRINLDNEFEGWWADIRTNPPVGLLLDAVINFQKAQAESPDDLSKVMPPIYDMLTLTVNEWNFVDEKGRDLPANLEGIKKIPLELLITLAQQVQEVVVGLPLASSGKPSSQS